MRCSISHETKRHPEDRSLALFALLARMLGLASSTSSQRSFCMGRKPRKNIWWTQGQERPPVFFLDEFGHVVLLLPSAVGCITRTQPPRPSLLQKREQNAVHYVVGYVPPQPFKHMKSTRQGSKHSETCCIFPCPTPPARLRCLGISAS